MASHNVLGKTGEELAYKWLRENDYVVLYKNWRHSHYEIDIIAEKNGMLHFIEVKTRRSKRFGNPEESVTKKKILNLMKAAEEFLYQFPEWKRIQYDVLSIMITKNGDHEYFWIEDVYV